MDKKLSFHQTLAIKLTCHLDILENNYSTLSWGFWSFFLKRIYNNLERITNTMGDINPFQMVWLITTFYVYRKTIVYP